MPLRGPTLVVMLAAVLSGACGSGGGKVRPPADPSDVADVRGRDAREVTGPDGVRDGRGGDDGEDPSECRRDEDCDDAEPCTADLCEDGGRCVHPPVGGACDDGDPCTAPDACDKGACGGEPVSCPDDEDPCTAPRCFPGQGCGLVCSATPACTAECVGDAGCDDGDPESVDLCRVAPCSAACVHTWTRCDDSEPCTHDEPDATGECVHVAVDGGCEDGDLCTEGDRCVQGRCRGTPVVCDDGNPCTSDRCEAARGCASEPAADGAGCDDGNACTLNDACAGGACAGAARVCPEDPDPCALAYCDPVLGCQTFCRGAGECAPECVLDRDCRDADPCSVERCVETACSRRCAYTSDPCEDGEFCTIDYCDGACRHVWWCVPCDPGNAAERCEDFDACTVDACHSDGFCTYSAMECGDDGDPCTLERCDAERGCTFGCAAGCDGEGCTSDADCDDGDACTADGCASGRCGRSCRNAALVCTAASRCAAAVCQDGGCVTSVPVVAPTIDGVVGDDWHSGSLGGAEGDASGWPGASLSELRVETDGVMLYVGVMGGTAGLTHAIVGYLDVDFGEGTGVRDLARLDDTSGALDRALSGCGRFDVPGFGAEVGFGTVGMTSAYGAAETAGWRGLGTRADGTFGSHDNLRWMPAGRLAANVGERGVEAAVALDAVVTAPIGPEGRVMALVVGVTDAAAACSFCDQTLPDQGVALDPAAPVFTVVYPFLVRPDFVDCCVTAEDCRDADPCTRDVCVTGTCRHQAAGCAPTR